MNWLAVQCGLAGLLVGIVAGVMVERHSRKVYNLRQPAIVQQAADEMQQREALRRSAEQNSAAMEAQRRDDLHLRRIRRHHK